MRRGKARQALAFSRAGIVSRHAQSVWCKAFLEDLVLPRDLNRPDEETCRKAYTAEPFSQ